MLASSAIDNYTVDSIYGDKEDTSNAGNSAHTATLHLGLQRAIVAGAD